MTAIQVRLMRAGASGKNAWQPVIGIAQDGTRLVMQIVDWVGGEGEKPVTGLYIGPNGYVDEIGKAVDVKGVGQKGWSPVLSAEQDGERRVVKVQDWAGGEGVKPDAGLYVGFSGLTADISAAIDIRGPQGAKGDTGAKGDQGQQGLQGPLPGHQWTGTALAFQKPDGSYETPVNLQGPQGIQGIQGPQGVQGPTGSPATQDSITNFHLANMAAGTIKGALAAGDPQDLSAAQVLQLLGFSLADLVPVGAIQDWAFTTAPSGWLVMAGQLVSRAAYPKLWALVQASARLVTDAAWNGGDWGTFSSGDGSTTFRLPDPRGVFIRAADSGRGMDGGRTLASFEEQSTQNHSHILPLGWDNGALYYWQDSGGNPMLGSEVIGGAQRLVAPALPTGYSAIRIGYTGAINSGSLSGETRPKNIAWHKIIRAA